MARRPVTITFSALSRDDAHTPEDIASYCAASYDRTVKRRPGRPPGAALRARMDEALEQINAALRNKEQPQAIADRFGVPVEVIEEYVRTR